jgi:hypothetical protein
VDCTNACESILLTSSRTDAIVLSLEGESWRTVLHQDMELWIIKSFVSGAVLFPMAKNHAHHIWEQFWIYPVHPRL